MDTYTKNAFTAEVKYDFEETLSKFMDAFKNIIYAYLKEIDGKDMRNWVNAICDQLTETAFLDSVCAELMVNNIRNENDKIIIHLLTLELKAVTEYMEYCNNGNNMFGEEKVGRKEGIKAGGVVLNSIKDLLGKDAPYWLKSLFTIGKEGVDVLTGS